jgi:hypothetical protein
VIAAFRANPGLALYKLQSYAYKYSWALIPISVPMPAVAVSVQPPLPAYDHTVFVTYSLSFMTLLSVVLMVADRLGLPGVSLATLVVPPL